MRRKRLYQIRLDWVAKYLATDESAIEELYAEHFCQKILGDFHATGIIPESKFKYISMCVGYDENKKVRKFLTEVGIKHRVYAVYDGFEFLIRKSDYNLYKLTLDDGVFNEKNFSTDIDIGKMYEDYKQYEKTLKPKVKRQKNDI